MPHLTEVDDRFGLFRKGLLVHALPLPGLATLPAFLARKAFSRSSASGLVAVNEAMKLERADALGAMPYQRSESRRGYANGFKPKTVNSIRVIERFTKRRVDCRCSLAR